MGKIDIRGDRTFSGIAKNTRAKERSRHRIMEEIT